MPSISLLKISQIGLSLVYKIPQKKTPGMFTFFSPLSSTIWICIVAAYFLASLVLYILSILPQAKQKICQTKSRQSQEECEPEITLINSFWFTMASILQQGTDFMPRQIHANQTVASFQNRLLTPDFLPNISFLFLQTPNRSIATRIMASTWWFFTILMVSTYTANLAAFLTIEKLDSPINSIEDLANQHTVKYGTLCNGSSFEYFKVNKNRKAISYQMLEVLSYFP